MLIVRRVLLVSYLALIACLSLMPGEDLPGIEIWDKLQHFAAYALMTLFLAFASRNRRQFFLVLPLLFLWSMGIEVAQGVLTRDRYFEMMDGLANLLGLGLGVLVCFLLEKTIARRWLFAEPVE